MFTSLINQLPSALSSAIGQVRETILTPEPLLHKDIGSIIADNFDVAALNPQPLPPKEIADLFSPDQDAVSLNPQPLQPKEIADLFSPDQDAVALNPQPIPPGFDPEFATDGDFAGPDILGGGFPSGLPTDGPDWPLPITEAMSDEFGADFLPAEFDIEAFDPADFDMEAELPQLELQNLVEPAMLY